MTAILVVVQDGQAWVGSDSRVMVNDTYRDDADKVLQRHGWVWGVAGSALTASWLRTKSSPQRDGEEDEEYLMSVSENAIAWLATKANGSPTPPMFHLVAAKAGEAWVLGVSVERIRSLYAAGDPTAPVAAFLCTNKNLPIPERITTAIGAVAQVSSYVGGKVQVIEAI